MGSPENLINHVPCLGPGPSGCSAHRTFCLGPDTRFEPCLFPTFFLVPSFLFCRQLFCSITNLSNRGGGSLNRPLPIP